jgi:hypothetical protein
MITKMERFKRYMVIVGPYLGAEVEDPQSFEEFREQIKASEKKLGFDRTVVTMLITDVAALEDYMRIPPREDGGIYPVEIWMAYAMYKGGKQ